MLNLELGHGPRSLAMKEPDMFVFEMLVSEKTNRVEGCVVSLVVVCFSSCGRKENGFIFTVHRPYDPRQPQPDHLHGLRPSNERHLSGKYPRNDLECG